MLTIPKQQLYRKYDLMPQELKDFLFSEVNSDLLWAIGDAHHLSDDKKFDLSKIVGDVVLGFIHPNDLAKNIAADLGIDLRLAQTIDDEIERKIFYSIKSLLVKNYQPLASMGPSLISDVNKPDEINVSEMELEPAVIMQNKPKTETELGSFFLGLNGGSAAIKDEKPKADAQTPSAVIDAPKIIHEESGARPGSKTKNSFGGLLGIFKGGGNKKQASAVAAEVNFGANAKQPKKEEVRENAITQSNAKSQTSDVSDKGQLVSLSDFGSGIKTEIKPRSESPVSVFNGNAVNLPQENKEADKNEISDGLAKEVLQIEKEQAPKISDQPRVVHYSNLMTPVTNLQSISDNLRQNSAIKEKPEIKSLNESVTVDLKNKPAEINLSQFSSNERKDKIVETEIKKSEENKAGEIKKFGEIKSNEGGYNLVEGKSKGGFFGFFKKKESIVSDTNKEIAVSNKEDNNVTTQKVNAPEIKPAGEITGVNQQQNKPREFSVGEINLNQFGENNKLKIENPILTGKIEISASVSPKIQQDRAVSVEEFGPKIIHEHKIDQQEEKTAGKNKEASKIEELKQKKKFSFFGILKNKKNIVEIPINNLQPTTYNQQQRGEEGGKEKSGDIGQSANRESQSVGENTVGMQLRDQMPNVSGKMLNIAKGIDNIKADNLTSNTARIGMAEKPESPKVQNIDHIELKDIPVKEEDTIDLRQL